jgi:hypothetical protein
MQVIFKIKTNSGFPLYQGEDTKQGEPAVLEMDQRRFGLDHRIILIPRTTTMVKILIPNIDQDQN